MAQENNELPDLPEPPAPLDIVESVEEVSTWFIDHSDLLIQYGVNIITLLTSEDFSYKVEPKGENMELFGKQHSVPFPSQAKKDGFK